MKILDVGPKLQSACAEKELGKNTFYFYIHNPQRLQSSLDTNTNSNTIK